MLSDEDTALQYAATSLWRVGRSVFLQFDGFFEADFLLGEDCPSLPIFAHSGCFHLPVMWPLGIHSGTHKVARFLLANLIQN